MRPCFWLVLALHAAGRKHRNTNIDAGIVHETMLWRVLAYELAHALLYVCLAFVCLLHVLLPTVAACCHAAAANSCWLPLCWCGCLVLRWCLCCLLLTLVTVKLRAVSVKLRVFAGNKLCQMHFEDHVRNASRQARWLQVASMAHNAPNGCTCNGTDPTVNPPTGGESPCAFCHFQQYRTSWAGRLPIKPGGSTSWLSDKVVKGRWGVGCSVCDMGPFSRYGINTRKVSWFCWRCFLGCCAVSLAAAAAVAAVAAAAAAAIAVVAAAAAGCTTLVAAVIVVGAADCQLRAASTYLPPPGRCGQAHWAMRTDEFARGPAGVSLCCGHRCSEAWRTSREMRS